MLRRQPQWPQRAAIIITQGASNFGLLVKELLRSVHWRVIDVTPSASVALNRVQQGQANLVVVDDCQEYPSSYTLRTLLTQPVGILTPTLVFINDSRPVEAQVLRSMGRPVTIAKPLTPHRFLAGFESLIDQWSDGYFVALRDAFLLLSRDSTAAAIAMLQQLSKFGAAACIATPALAKLLVKQGEVRAAEKMLLRTLREYPRDIGIILALVDIYLEFAMPDLAYRILKSVQSGFNYPVALAPDLLQAMLMTDRLGKAVEQASSMSSKQFLQPHAEDILAKVITAQGKLSEVQRMQHHNPIMQGIIKTWQRHQQVIPATSKAG